MLSKTTEGLGEVILYESLRHIKFFTLNLVQLQSSLTPADLNSEPGTPMQFF